MPSHASQNADVMTDNAVDRAIALEAMRAPAR
jgi:hypothetical protein